MNRDPRVTGDVRTSMLATVPKKFRYQSRAFSRIALSQDKEQKVQNAPSVGIKCKKTSALRGLSLWSVPFPSALPVDCLESDRDFYVTAFAGMGLVVTSWCASTIHYIEKENGPSPRGATEGIDEGAGSEISPLLYGISQR
jgi:hypothetical protein